MAIAGRILVADDERGIRDLLSTELASHGFEVATAADGRQALRLLRAEARDLLITDLKMPGLDGLALLREAKGLHPELEVIVSTGYGTVESAVEAMKHGAYDFIQKPFNLDEILALVEKALEKSELKAMLGIYETSLAVFASLDLQALLPLAARVAARVLKAPDAAVFVQEGQGLRLAAAHGPAGEAALRKLAERAQDPAPGEDSTFVFPLSLGGERLGVLAARRGAGGRPFGPAERRHATVLCAQLAQALRNARLFCELELKMREAQALQESLVQSEKLATVGVLAAGVAHEINNPLTGILGFAELLAQAPGLTAEQREDVAAIKHQSLRCRQIVRDLLQFSRRRPPLRELISLKDVLEPTLALIRCDLRAAGVQLRVDVPGDLPPMNADRTQLEQVLLNLATNARQAMEGRSVRALTVRASLENGRLVVRVSDTGRGIARENLAKVFDPFFTTKEVGQGTGLGLSVSYGIVREHGGTIRVESEEGTGTTVVVELPVAAAEDGPTPAKPGESPLAAGGGR